MQLTIFLVSYQCSQLGQFLDFESFFSRFLDTFRILVARQKKIYHIIFVDALYSNMKLIAKNR